jgi:SAM-dependent methyltransferase
MRLPGSGESGGDTLYGDPELAVFYDLDNGRRLDIEFCRNLAAGASSVLDLGCGTGLLAAALADDRLEVVGADPAKAMLDIARYRPGGGGVTWLEADARGLRLGRRFDLVVLTGHAFQVFLGLDDQRAVLDTIARHLAPGGRFIFDTRNPLLEEWREWNPETSRRTFDHPRHGTVEAWNDVEHDAATDVVTYGTYYRMPATGRILAARSRIRFAAQPLVAGQVAAAGLLANTWLGDWRGGPFTTGSPEIIPLGGLG